MIAVALTLVGAACSSEPRATRAHEARAAGAPVRAHASLPTAESVHGLALPQGAERIASNDLGDDYVVPFPIEAVLEHLKAELGDANFSPIDPQGGRFRRVTPRGAPATIKLYVMAMPYPGRGTLIRIQRLPEQELTPETLERNVRRFETEQHTLD